MQTKTYNVYKYDELTKDQQQKAIDNLRDINTDYEWWNFVGEDGSEIELKKFDLYRQNCEIEFANSAEQTARAIKENHGKHCDTYILSVSFLKDYKKIEPLYLKGDDSFDDLYSDLGQEYKNELSGMYLKMLQTEHSYRTSNEAIIKTSQANDYDFTSDGKIN